MQFVELSIFVEWELSVSPFNTLGWSWWFVLFLGGLRGVETLEEAMA